MFRTGKNDAEIKCTLSENGHIESNVIFNIDFDAEYLR